jgi:hypothetical protein
MGMKEAKQLTKFFSDEMINEIKLVSVRNSIRDIVKKSRDNGFHVTDKQHDALVKAKVWIYRHRKSRGVLGKPAKVKVFTKEEIEKYQKGLV